MSFSKINQKVFVTRPDFPEDGLNILKENFDVTIWEKPTVIPKNVFLKEIVGKSALYCYPANIIDLEVLEAAGPNLKVIGTCSVGYDHIDVNECRKRGIRIGYTPDILTDATAELTVALLLATSRRMVEANREVYTGGWSSWSPKWLCGPGIKDAIIGIFGFGRIGQEVAKRCVPFKPSQIIYSSRSEKLKEANEVGAKHVAFEKLLSCSDVIVVCSSLNEDTKFIFNKEAFEKMKPNLIFINTARGTVVDQNALYDALKKGRIYAAGLDVTTPEPLPVDHPILKLKNCVVLPHIGSATINTRKEMSIVTAKNILFALQEKEMVFELK